MKEFPSKLERCSNVDCVRGIDVECFNMECGTCHGVGMIISSPLSFKKINDKWHVTIDVDFLLENQLGEENE